MTDYEFQFIALGANGNPAPHAVGSMYAPDDSGFATPLTVTGVLDGTVGTTAKADRYGLVRVIIADVWRGRWKSGSVPSFQVASFEAADQAAADAAASRLAAEAAQALAEQAFAPTEDQVRLVVTTDIADPASDIAVSVSGTATGAVTGLKGVPGGLAALDANGDVVDANGNVVTGGGGVSQWGDLTGTLSAQTDLAAALDAKQPVGDYATTTDVATAVDAAAGNNGRVMYGTGWPATRPADYGQPLIWDDTALALSTGADTAGPDSALLVEGDYWDTYRFEAL